MRVVRIQPDPARRCYIATRLDTMTPDTTIASCQTLDWQSWCPRTATCTRSLARQGTAHQRFTPRRAMGCQPIAGVWGERASRYTFMEDRELTPALALHKVSSLSFASAAVSLTAPQRHTRLQKRRARPNCTSRAHGTTLATTAKTLCSAC